MSTANERRISNDLYDLTESLVEDGLWPNPGGGLGGSYGYGVDYENDVFEMHPFWWGECECGFEGREWEWGESHDHADSCYQKEILRRGFIDYDDPRHHTMKYDEMHAHNERVTDAVCTEMGLDPKFGTYVHCTCYREPARVQWRAENDHDPKCGVARPNFLHKESNVRVDWYKYIGRGMEHKPIDKAVWKRVMDECHASITANPTPEPKPEPMSPEEEAQWIKDNVYVFGGTFPEVMQQVEETFHPVESIEALERP